MTFFNFMGFGLRRYVWDDIPYFIFTDDSGKLGYTYIQNTWTALFWDLLRNWRSDDRQHFPF